MLDWTDGKNSFKTSNFLVAKEALAKKYYNQNIFHEMSTEIDWIHIVRTFFLLISTALLIIVLAVHFPTSKSKLTIRSATLPATILPALAINVHYLIVSLNYLFTFENLVRDSILCRISAFFNSFLVTYVFLTGKPTIIIS